MVRGLYTATTGMIVQRNKMDVVTNNLANVETTGYKKDTLLTSTFDAVMLSRINDPNVNIIGTSVGTYSYGTHVNTLYTDFTEGNLEQTDRPTDLAIEGSGFFSIETPAGERYTRSGNFAVNSEGYLVTEDGNYVLGENGRIKVGSTDFSVSADGTVTAGGQTVDKLKIVGFSDVNVLRKQGNNLYYALNNVQPVQTTNYDIKQGVQESSNVNTAQETVDMLSIYRNYEADQKIVSMTDESLRPHSRPWQNRRLIKQCNRFIQRLQP